MSAAPPILTRRAREREGWTGRRAADLDPAQLAQAKTAGYEPGDDGWMVGRDPRSMTPAELQEMGHEAVPPSEAIRSRCLDCCAGSAHEVRLCAATSCPSWPRRMGSDPFRAPRQLTAEQREAQRERGRALARRKAATVAGDDRRSSSDAEKVEGDIPVPTAAS